MIYENIRAVCEKQGKSLSSLEREAGLGNGTIGKWRRAQPNITSLCKVAEALNVPITKLMKE